MQGKPSKMMQAFIDQKKVYDEEVQALDQQMRDENERKALLHLATPKPSLAEAAGIATQLKEGELDQKTEVHPNLRGYDHSLDMPRIRFGEDGGEILADGVKIPEPEPEGLRLCPRGMPEIEGDPIEGTEDLPELGIDWDSIGKKLGL